jgi:hypothetical protein
MKLYSEAKVRVVGQDRKASMESRLIQSNDIQDVFRNSSVNM